jgi:hypothetical protein
MCSMSVHIRKLFTCMANQHMHFYKHVLSRIISLLKHIAVTPATIISMSGYKNTISIKIIVKH